MKDTTDEQRKPPAPHDPAKRQTPQRDVLSPEPSEVAGRHRNTGQKDHQGAR